MLNIAISLVLLIAVVHADVGNKQAFFDSKSLEDIADIVIKKTGLDKNVLASLADLEDIVQAQGLQIVSLKHKVTALESTIREHVREEMHRDSEIVNPNVNQQEEIYSSHIRTTYATNMTDSGNFPRKHGMHTPITSKNKQKTFSQNIFAHTRTHEKSDSVTERLNTGKPPKIENNASIYQDTDLNITIKAKSALLQQHPLDKTSKEDNELHQSLIANTNGVIATGITDEHSEDNDVASGKEKRTGS